MLHEEGEKLPPPTKAEERQDIVTGAVRRASVLQRFIIHLRPLQLLPIWVKYLLSLCIVLFFFLMRYAFSYLFPHPFLLFTPAVVLAAFIFDKGSGFLAAIVASVLSYYFFMPPEQNFAYKGIGEIVSAFFFLGIGFLASWILEALRVSVDELASSMAALEITNKRLDEFAHIVSHDLKEPVRGLQNFSTFILEDYGDKIDGTGQAQLRTLSEQAKRMGTLIDSLLHYTLIGRDGHQEMVNVNEVIADVLESMETITQQENVDIHVEKDMPAVVCNKILLGEVFRNLITNALKYNDKPEKLIEIGSKTVEGKPEKKVFFVRDNGIGIEKKYHETVFQMFKRLHARDQYGGGTGSGLAIVKKIIEDHHGKIWVDSEPGKGSTFYFWLGI